MRQPPVLIKQISQKDNHHFTIEWSDGIAADYRLSDLQRKCPCAQCYDPATGKQICGEKDVSADVRAINIINVGRYALKVQFTSGCSKGIYSFAMLRHFVKESV